jgi:hypothetical protein
MGRRCAHRPPHPFFACRSFDLVLTDACYAEKGRNMPRFKKPDWFERLEDYDKIRFYLLEWASWPSTSSTAAATTSSAPCWPSFALGLPVVLPPAPGPPPARGSRTCGGASATRFDLGTCRRFARLESVDRFLPGEALHFDHQGFRGTCGMPGWTGRFASTA